MKNILIIGGTKGIGKAIVDEFLGADMTANTMTNQTIRKENNKRSTIK